MIKEIFKLLSFLMIVSITLSCTPNYDLKDIQTGIANFQISNDKNYTKFSYTYFSSFLSIPQAAFGIFFLMNLAINNLQSRPIINYQDFYIVIGNKTITQIDYLLVHKQSWSLITINFILSSRSDLVFDSFAINTIQQISKNLIVQIKPKYKFQQFTTKIFLNGFQMDQRVNSTNTGLDISIKLVSFSQSTLDLNFTGNSFSQIKTVYFSYAMIGTGVNAYISDQGFISILGLKGVDSRDLQKSFIQSQYKLYGVNNLNFSVNNIALISSIRSDLTSTIYSTTLIDSLMIDYFILSNHPKNMCVCDDKTLKYSFNNLCLSSCPQNTFPYSYPDGGYVCLLKPVQIINPVTNTILSSNTVNILPQTIQNQTLSNQQIKINQSLTISNSCETQKNLYFDGKICACIPGYKNITNQCVAINSDLQPSKNNTKNALNSNLTCSGLNEVNLNGVCTCINGYQKVDNQCIIIITSTCGQNAFLNGNQCMCLPGYVKTLNGTCQSKAVLQLVCPTNQINNGLDVCICQQDYYNVSGQCVIDKPCPLNSIKNPDGSCTCKSNYLNISGECSVCPSGQYWEPKSSQCVLVCGQNSIKNQTTGKCQCIPTFGISKQNKCQFCPSNKLILNNYCVSCPQNQYYNQTLSKCQCNPQFQMETNGLCLQKCPNNQYFDSVLNMCQCRSTLGRLNGVCQICPSNYYVKDITQECMPCDENSVSIRGKCVCKNQFVPNAFGKCVPCGLLTNTFMYQGRCSTCPGEKIYNGTSCICPAGTIFRELKCIKVCKDDELMDMNGSCYKCPVNEVVMNNQCVCRKNYQRVNDTSCQLICPSGSFIIKGRCSVCPFGQMYDSVINGCRCPDGLYLNVNYQCQSISVSLISCPTGQYLDMQKGCTNCISSCDKCSNNLTCSTCQLPYSLSSGKCKDICGNGVVQTGQECDDRNLNNGDGCSSTCKIEKNFKCSGNLSVCITAVNEIKCGNGIIQTNQQCDDNNTLSNDGCSSICKIQRMYSCYGQPSVCNYNASFHICGNGFVEFSQQCDDANFINGDGCSSNCTVQTGFICINNPSNCSKNITTGMALYGKINYNLNNIYISLQTDQKYQLNSVADMEDFIKVSYLNTTYKPSTYCTQRDYPDLDIFDCLLLYSSGVPNKAFTAEFSYISPVNDTVIKLQINVDPLSLQAQKINNLRRS